jgi:hypothetical protein
MSSASPGQPPPASGLPVVPDERSGFDYQRWTQIALRAVHIASMGLLLGGIAMGGTRDTLLGPIIATVASGLLLLVAAVAWGCISLDAGAGWALFLKLGLLGLGNVFEAARLPLYLAATVLTSVASHMPGHWRHLTLRRAARPADRDA